MFVSLSCSYSHVGGSTLTFPQHRNHPCAVRTAGFTDRESLILNKTNLILQQQPRTTAITTRRHHAGPNFGSLDHLLRTCPRARSKFFSDSTPFVSSLASVIALALSSLAQKEHHSTTLLLQAAFGQTEEPRVSRRCRARDCMCVLGKRQFILPNAA